MKNRRPEGLRYKTMNCRPPDFPETLSGRGIGTSSGLRKEYETADTREEVVIG